jgi:tryptophanyl-tRNA synthetase
LRVFTRSPDAILKKFKRAVTDSDNEVIYDRAKKPGVSNLLDILSAATGTTQQALADQYSQYGKLKSDCGDAVVAMLQPIQAQYADFIADPAQLDEMLSLGALKAEAIAQKTLQRAQQAIGMTPRR